MRLRFRTVLAGFVVALLVVTVSVIGITSFLSARETADDLSTQILEQTAERCDEQVRSELGLAVGQSRLDTSLFAHGRIDPRDPEAATSYFIDAIRARPQLSFLSWTLDDTGNHVEVERERDGTLRVVHLLRQPD